jgi:hypothetical protein
MKVGISTREPTHVPPQNRFFVAKPVLMRPLPRWEKRICFLVRYRLQWESGGQEIIVISPGKLSLLPQGFAEIIGRFCPKGTYLLEHVSLSLSIC